MAECSSNGSLGVAGRPGEWYSFAPDAANAVYEVRLLAESNVGGSAFSSSIVPDILDGYGDRVPTSVPPTVYFRPGASVLRWNTSNAGPGPFFVRATASARHSVAVAAPVPYRVDSMPYRVDSMVAGDQGTWNGSAAVRLSIDVGEAVRVSMPFAFTFYGVEYSQMWVSSSGYISFEEQDSGGFANVGSIYSAMVACGGEFKPSSEDDAAVTVEQSETELQIRWRGALFNSSELSDVSLLLRRNGSLSIEWAAVHLSSGGSLETGLAAWPLSDDLLQNSSLEISAQIIIESGNGNTGSLALGADTSALILPMGSSRYFRFRTLASDRCDRYLFSGDAKEATGILRGVVSGAVLTADRFGAPSSAYSFNAAILSKITVPSPFVSGDSDFTIAMWLQPTIVGDASWHGFVGYCEGNCRVSRSPSMFVNSNSADPPWSPAGQGHALHWDTRTTQHGDGTRHAGIVPRWFAAGEYVHTVWAATAGLCNSFYKNGELMAAPDAAPYIDLFDAYNIGSVADSQLAFDGVIDEVAFYNYAMTATAVSDVYGGGSDGLRSDGVYCDASICVGKRQSGDATNTSGAGFFVAISVQAGPFMFNGGRTFCQAQGFTDLASIHSVDEMKMAEEVCGHLGNTTCFTGLHANESRWEWSDGSSTGWITEQLVDGSGLWGGLGQQEPNSTFGDGTPAWHFQGMSEPATALICEDRVRYGVELVGGSSVVLQPLMLGGATVAVSSWVQLNGVNRGVALFSSYQSAQCGSSIQCKNAVGERLDSHGWLAIGTHSGRDLFVPGVVFDSALSDDFFIADDWMLVTFSFIERRVHVYVDGVGRGVGTLEADVPRMLRNENSIGGSLGTQPLSQLSHFAAADFRVYDRSLSSLEAAALHSNPSSECCLIAGLIDAVGVGSVDLTPNIMAALAHPSAVTANPESAEGSNGTAVDLSVQPCSQSDAAAAAAVREVDICGDEANIEDCDGVISDGVGPYIASASCGLHLHGYRGGKYTLDFEEFDTEANVDFLTVYDGTSESAPLLGRFSGSELPPTLQSTQPSLFLRFVSNDNAQGVGFRAAFSCSGKPVEYWKPSDVAVPLPMGKTVAGIQPSSLHAVCLDAVLLSVQCCADAATDCANAR
eukprot:SAG22_NODE_82_length_21749_cov_10.719769_9_plen_1119_part_00